MWIDSHCHLDAYEWSGQSQALVQAALARGVRTIVVPAVAQSSFHSTLQMAKDYPSCVMALGIHPIYTPTAKENDLQVLRSEVERLLNEEMGKKLVAIGEIGLDFFVPQLCEPELREKQIHFYVEQLKIARDYHLPVLLHVRKSCDQILKYLRRFSVKGGIAHAFNGSEQQAKIFIELGLVLGLGGAMTFNRALHLQRLAKHLPLSSIVLETDAPDISPAWLHPEKNTPEQIPAIGNFLASLRGIRVDTIAQQTTQNVYRVLPRLKAYVDSLNEDN